MNDGINRMEDFNEEQFMEAVAQKMYKENQNPKVTYEMIKRAAARMDEETK